MKPIHNFIVKAKLPENIEKLKDVAYNYWWCWDSEAKELFNRMNRKIWNEVHHNPIALINRLPQKELEELSKQYDFTNFLEKVHNKFTRYIKARTWFQEQNIQTKGVIAYFSPEYGINESFPVYSGGLGVLSGDHLKSASDLGLPLIGVGLLYQQGYFRQRLSPNGWQNELYPVNDFYSMPMFLVRDESGVKKIISVDLPNGKVFAQIWKILIGRTFLYLLDTNIDENTNQEYKNITDQLYGGDRETRIQQEILLGIGGIRALNIMGIEPSVIHTNEGHAAFALLEQTRNYMAKYNIDFHSAMNITRGSSIFTTHTPVPAGNEAFNLDRMEVYFKDYIPLLGLTKEDFFAMGQTAGLNYNEAFSMTILGLRLTGYHNGVSKLHGKVSQKMWSNIWKCLPVEEVPIDGLTNGVHTHTWLAHEFSELYERYLQPSWETDLDNEDIWNAVTTIPNDELWREKQRRRIRLVLFAREYLKTRGRDYLRQDQLNKINEYLDPDALTIGFARRFATYKRPYLIFSDMKRLKNILTNKEKPVQIILAGKAHPHDTEGKQMIQMIIQKVRDFNLEKHIVFLEDYDMVISRLMVKGCDVWLNNPIRPLEASGTSGMKAAINGTLNCSILDGWWDEAYNGKNGFAIGQGEERENNPEINQLESELLYDLLENEIIPTFYDRGQTRVPSRWVEMMKCSIRSITPMFSTHRMVKEYATKYYFNALEKNKLLLQNNAQSVVELNKWKSKIYANWDKIIIKDIEMKNDHEAWLGKPIEVNVKVNLAELSPDDVVVQAYYGSVDVHTNELIDTQYTNLNLIRKDDDFYLYNGTYICETTGKQGFTIRVLPNHPLMIRSSDLYLCKWPN
jgi:starch phosphorylase